MIFLRLAGFFQQFLKYVCPAFSAPLSAPACAYPHADRCTAQAGGFRSGVLRTPRLNTLEGNPVQLGRGGKRQKSEIGRQNAEDKIAGFCEVIMPCNIIHVVAMGEQITNFTKIGIIGNLRDSLLIYPHCFRNFLLRPSPPKIRRAGPP